MWARLHDALQKPNWSDPSLGGKLEWGPVKLGHASPRTANSGVETLTLLAYAYAKKGQGLTANDLNNPEFQSWLSEIEGTVSDFPASTDLLFSSFLLRGPSAYDVIVAYENQAVANVERTQWGALQVIYPAATMLSDHPFAILDAAWVAPEQQEAARMFRDYLLSEPAQRLALRYGFRPANSNVLLTANEPGNMFLAASAIGVKPELPGGVEAPSPEVTDALIRLWQKQTGR